LTILAGIDYSFTSPSVCIYNTDEEFKFENLKFFNMGDKKKLAGIKDNIDIQLFPPYSSQEERFRNIASWASDKLERYSVTEACIEGYSFGASSGLVFQIAENAGLVKQYMDINSIKFTTPPPSQVKKFFTGKGNSKKDAMVDKFHDMFDHIKLHDMLGIKPMAKPIDDLVDSLAVLMCHEHFTKEVKL
jgi:Holliday junction resolvasome RuvABC endonuclease subunit